MIKVRVEKVKRGYFKGYVEAADLTQEQRDLLHLGDYLSCDVEGEFSYGGASDDIQIIEISCYAYNDIHDLKLTADLIDEDDLVEQVREGLGYAIYE